jgi:hypothetical protein
VGKRGREVEGKWKPRGAVCGLGSGRNKFNKGGAAAGRRRLSFSGLGFFVFFFLILSKLPLLGFELKAAIYRQSIFSGFKIGPSSFVFGP